MELDFEDFVEEVKFQMVEYEILTEEIILEWEEKVRGWVETHKTKKNITYKAKDDIMISIKNEEVMFDMAAKFFHAVKYNQVGDYWKRFAI